MLKQLLIFTILFAQASFGATERACSNLFVKSSLPVSVDIRLVKNVANRDLIEKSTFDLLAMVKGHMILPHEIFLINTGGSPRYKDGMITIEFPVFRYLGTTKLKKSPQDSLGVNIHEVGHQIFEESIKKWYEKDPEIIWAFFTRVDGVAALDSLEFIKNSKALTKYKKESNSKIQERFLEYTIFGSPYNELFADTITVFSLQDPKAIYKSLYFEKLEKSGDEIDRKYNADHVFRRFDQDVVYNESLNGLDKGPYNVFAPTRAFIWRHIFVNYQKQHPEITRGELLARITKTIVRSFKGITKNFEVSPNDISGLQMNEHLQRELSAEFRK